MHHFLKISQRILLLLSGIFIFSQAQAGWILTGRYIDREGRTILQRLFIQDNKVRFEQFDAIYTLDLNTGTIILVDPVKLVYHQSTIAAFISDYQAYKKAQLQQLLKSVPGDQQEQVRLDSEAGISRFGDYPLFSDSLLLSQVEDTLKAVGLPTEKYLVSMNKLKMEEIWIAPGLDVRQHIDWKKYFHYMSVVAPEIYIPLYCFSGSFLELLNNGYPVRRIMIQSGFRTEQQVNRREEKVIPDYEFGPPDLCKKVGFTEWINRLPGKNTENDDYE